jgi:methionine-rich copper-binding protein CopC
LTPVTSTLAPGVYTVTWHALAKDGHKTNGTYSFTVQPG